MAKEVILRREVYCFEFSFKPLRQIYIDVPQPNGLLKRKLVWYMVYRIRYGAAICARSQTRSPVSATVARSASP